MITKTKLLAGMAVFVLASCGTHKAVVEQKPVLKSVPKSTTGDTLRTADDSTRNKLSYIQHISDKALYQKNVVSNLTFTVNNGRKDITVPGILRMRKDEVVRLQLLLPILHSEVGRIEFAKDYVLFIDRIHRQYVKANYNDVAFLRDNGISFYTLQALFWNQLFIPRQQRVSEADMSQFSVDTHRLEVDGSAKIVLRDGKMTYKWFIPARWDQIAHTAVSYTSPTHGTSELSWFYKDFKPFGSKQFPASQSVEIHTPAIGQRPAKTLKASFELDGFSDASDWEPFTTPSDKYTKVSVEEILGKLMNF